jgi:hypothetical protein
MFDFTDEAVDFENMIVSAPSSIMSICSAMSGIPAYYHAGNYLDFNFDSAAFWNFRDILCQHGYTNYSILNSRGAREKMRGILDPVSNDFWEPNLKHSQPGWPNADISRTLMNVLDSNPTGPCFYLLWYNARRDPEISQVVAELLDELKRRDLFQPSVVMLHSDHGYPDLSRGLISDGWDLKKVGLPHDLVLTDDNIRVPFLLHYPGVTPKSISQPVSSEDITPTLLDLLGIPIPPPKSMDMMGRSLVPLMEGQPTEESSSKLIRTDARFSMQKDRITALRNEKYKFIIHHESGGVEFYDLANDPGEVSNLSEDPSWADEIEWFRQEFARSESAAIDFQRERIRKKVWAYFSSSRQEWEIPAKVWVVVFGRSYLYEAVVEALLDQWADVELHLTVHEEVQIPDAIESNCTTDRFGTLGSGPVFQGPEGIDLKLEIVDDPLSRDFMKTYARFRNRSGSTVLRIDGNVDFHNLRWPLLADPRVAYVRRVLGSLMEKKDLFLLEPTYLLKELKRLAGVFFSRKLGGS